MEQNFIKLLKNQPLRYTDASHKANIIPTLLKFVNTQERTHIRQGLISSLLSDYERDAKNNAKC